MKDKIFFKDVITKIKKGKKYKLAFGASLIGKN